MGPDAMKKKQEQIKRGIMARTGDKRAADKAARESTKITPELARKRLRQHFSG